MTDWILLPRAPGPSAYPVLAQTLLHAYAFLGTAHPLKHYSQPTFFPLPGIPFLSGSTHLPSQLPSVLCLLLRVHPHISASSVSPGPASVLPESLSCCFSQTIRAVDYLSVLPTTIHSEFLAGKGCTSFSLEPLRQGSSVSWR